MENQIQTIQFGVEKLSDVALIYKNQQTNKQTHFQVHSQVLANNCKYFETLIELDDQFHEMEIPDSILERTTNQTFHQFLQLIYSHNSVAFTGENILPLLHCAHYFDCRQMEIDATKYLIDMIKNNQLPSNLTMIQILSVADTYKLPGVVSTCMTELLTKNDAKLWFEEKKNEKFESLFSNLSSSTKNIVIATMEHELKVKQQTT
jgi:hypothetical protein